MANSIDKEAWCKDGLHGEPFHHKHVTSKWCPGCGDRNPEPISHDTEGMSETSKDSEEGRHHPNPNRERFTKIPDDADYQILTESPKLTPPSSITLPGPQRPYIQKGIGEQGRQESIAKNPVPKVEKLYSATKQFKLDVRPCRQIEGKDGKGWVWAIKDNGMNYVIY
jgi:hypothetical protein